MNFKEILELIDKVAESGIGSVEVEQAGTKVRIEGKNAPVTVHTVAAPESAPSPTAAAPQQTFAAPAPAPRAEETKSADAAATDPNVRVINSPIVGTFYRSANPEAPPFVNVGDRVSKGQVLCIIEAMKLMNEIESDHDGTLVAIYPQNGQPVEYGEKLFAIKV